ncbi:arabidopsis phospholipase-like protein [Striga asiatica]|uniref:Arabidopsis phospholipase-like protein n=1 Tax=Striga asiatica TaxID=4170 RepID=A0A5A7QTX3_STRAF|nr:arabidopsis phospholipase-like protein [Striga asiatica]
MLFSRFCEGVVSSHGCSGKNLVVFTSGLEEILDLNKDNGRPVKDEFSDQGTKTCGPVHASSHMPPEKDDSKYNGEELVGCRVKILRPKSKTFSEGVVASYDLSQKQHLVVYTDGVEEMMNLRKHGEPAEDVPQDQVPKSNDQARDSSFVYADEDKSARPHVVKKHKGQSFEHPTPSANPVPSTDLRKPKTEIDSSPSDSKISVDSSHDNLVSFNGYKVKSNSAPILEAVFAKYGDIMSCCIYKSTSVRASLLEVMSDIIQKLHYHDVEAILSELEDIENVVSDLEASRINVTWLKDHLAKLREIMGFNKKSLQLKKTKEKIGLVTKAAAEELKRRHVELVLAKERFKEAENRVSAMQLVSKKIEDDMTECESEEYFWKRRLDDLVN